MNDKQDKFDWRVVENIVEGNVDIEIALDAVKPKSSAKALWIRTFNSVAENDLGINLPVSYIVLCEQVDGTQHRYHCLAVKPAGWGKVAVAEVEAKAAAIHCGSELDQKITTSTHWDVLWEKHYPEDK
jgi:hypothetical protein